VVNGRIVVDGLMNIIAIFGFKQPMEILVKNGKAYEIKGGGDAKLRNLIEKGDKKTNTIAEFAAHRPQGDLWDASDEAWKPDLLVRASNALV